MSNDRLPNRLLVSAPVGCKRNVEQKRRWNDVVSGDFKQCGLLESWSEKAESATSSSSVVQSILSRHQKTKRRASEMTENDGVNNDW